MRGVARDRQAAVSHCVFRVHLTNSHQFQVTAGMESGSGWESNWADFASKNAGGAKARAPTVAVGVANSAGSDRYARFCDLLSEAGFTDMQRVLIYYALKEGGLELVEAPDAVR